MALTVAPSGSIAVELLLRSADLDAEIKVADIKLPFRARVSPDPAGDRLILEVDTDVEAVTDALLDILPPNPEAPDLDDAPDVGHPALGLLERRAEAYVLDVTRDAYPAVRDLAATDGWAVLAIAIAAYGTDLVLGDGYLDGSYLLRLHAAGRVLNLITGAGQ